MIRKRIVDVIFILLAGAFVFVFNNRPYYNWDTLPYMAIVLAHSEYNKDTLHKQVYSIMQSAEQRGEIRKGIFRSLTKRVPYRQECHADADKFNGELTYYRTKPLYNMMVYALYRSGVPIIKATIIPSLVAGFFLLIVFYSWIAVYVNRLIGLLVTALLALLPVFSEIQNSASPDALSALFVLLSLYLYDTGKNKALIWLCILLAILTRVDNVIFAAILGYTMHKPANRKPLFVLAIFGIAAFISLLLIPYISGNQLTWFTKFKYLESHVQYYFHVRNVFRDIFASSYYLLWITMGIILLVINNQKTKPLISIILSCIIIRLTLFPSLQERFFIAYEFALIIILAIAVNTLNKARSQNNMIRE